MDDELKEVFGELRAHERASVPDFETLIVDAPRSRRHAWRLASGVAMAAAIAAMLFWPRHMNDDAAPLSITQWRAPTDVLLVTPGNDLLRELPALNQSVIDLEAL